MRSRVEVIIPHLSRWDLLHRALISLEAQTVVPKICVVDNGSTDPTLHHLRNFRNVRVIPLGRNYGFGKAVNAGARSSLADTIIVMNNDMVASPRFVEALVERRDATGAAAVGALQLRPSGSIDTLGVMVDDALNAYDVGYGHPVSDAPRLAPQVLGPSGGAAAFSTQKFNAVGGYDERIFAYLEDVDLAIRLRTARCAFEVALDASVVHAHSGTLGSGSDAKNELLGWSRRYLLWKYRRSLSLRQRAKGRTSDAVVFLGKSLVDRNLAGPKGYFRASRSLRSPSPLPRLDIPTRPVTLCEGLALRRARRDPA